MAHKREFTIAELVEQSGVPATTIHHYRRLGLLPAPREVALGCLRYARNLRLLHLEDTEHPDDPFTLFNLGWTYQELGQTAEALRLLRRSLERSPSDASIVPKLYLLLVQGHRRLGEVQAAWAASHQQGTYLAAQYKRLVKRMGKKKWRREVAIVIAELTAALEPDYVVLGGGNAKYVRELPPNVRLGANTNAFAGGFRLWEEEATAKRSPRCSPPTQRAVLQT